MTDTVIWAEGTVLATPSREWQGTTYGAVTFITVDNDGNPQKKNNAMYWDLSNGPDARREMKQLTAAPKLA